MEDFSVSIADTLEAVQSCTSLRYQIRVDEYDSGYYVTCFTMLSVYLLRVYAMIVEVWIMYVSNQLLPNVQNLFFCMYVTSCFVKCCCFDLVIFCLIYIYIYNQLYIISNLPMPCCFMYEDYTTFRLAGKKSLWFARYLSPPWYFGIINNEMHAM